MRTGWPAACARMLVVFIVAVLAAAPVSQAWALPASPAPAVDRPPLDAWSRPLHASVRAESWVLMELDSGQLLAGHDHERRRPVASTVKVLTALTVLERADLTDLVEVGDEVVGVEGAGVGLAPGDVWTVAELIDALIARSGNEAAEALAVHVAGSRRAFLAMMREDAAELGLGEVVIRSPSGLGDGNLLSAHDLALLGAAALRHDTLRPFLSREAVTIPGEGPVETRNELLASYEGATGIKTGFTIAAGYALMASAERDGRELVAVVLGAGEDPARFVEAAALLDYGYDTTRTMELPSRMRLRVAGGVVEFTAPDATVTTPVGSTAELRLEVPHRAPEASLLAPISADGVEVGQLRLPRSKEPAADDDPAAQLGRALVDGVYAALRATTITHTLG